MSINLTDIPSINLSSIKTNYGSCGVQTVQHLQDSLKENDMVLMPTEKSNTFVVLGSSNLKSLDRLNRIIDWQYRGWSPSVIERKDNQGNYLVQLIPIVSEDFLQISKKSIYENLSIGKLIEKISELEKLIAASNSQC